MICSPASISSPASIMLLQVVQVVLLLVVLLLVGFGDAVMYDGALIWFKYEDDFGCCR